jgi:hypothetical protein
MIFKQNDIVEINNIDNSGKTYVGMVKGIAINFGDDPATIYIVEMADVIDPNYLYTHTVIPASCMRLS